MNGVGACGQPGCPVPHPDWSLVRRLRTTVWPADTPLRRGHKRTHPDPTALVPSVGDTRFAPLPGVSHVYLATTACAALLESALHDAQPPAPRVRPAQLVLWNESAVALAQDVRLVDLRDAELERLAIPREALVSTQAAHYPCTRIWAHQLHGRTIGGHPTHGLLWHSRQHELHARALAGRPALHDLLQAIPAEVAVLWAPPAPAPPLRAAAGGLGPLDSGPGLDYLLDLSAVLDITVL